MNVLFVTSGLGTGGAERSLLRLTSALQNRGFRLAVASLSGDATMLPAFSAAGVEAMALDLGRPAAWRHSWSLIRQRLTHRAPDLVQGWMYHGNLAASMIARDRVPVSWSVRQTLDGNRDRLLTRALIRLSASVSRTATAIVYNSHAARLQHEVHGFASGNGCVIHNGVPMPLQSANARRHARRLMDVSDDAMVVGHVARLHPSKDHRGFLIAFSKLLRHRPEVTAVLVGRGVDSTTPQLKTLVERLGLRDRVRLLGSRPDVDALYPGFDIFCMSSNAMEGFPNVVAEAMAASVPCVVTRVGDAAEIVGDTGLVVAEDDDEAMAAALCSLAAMTASDRQQLGERARARVAQRFNVEAMADAFVALFVRLTASTPAG